MQHGQLVEEWAKNNAQFGKLLPIESVTATVVTTSTDEVLGTPKVQKHRVIYQIDNMSEEANSDKVWQKTDRITSAPSDP